MCSPARDGGALHRVSPFGYRRIYARTRLPDAFRSVPRPSSALDAQASPVRLVWLGLSCGDRALPLSGNPVGFPQGLHLEFSKELLVIVPGGTMYTHDTRPLSVCLLRIVYSIIKVPSTGYRVPSRQESSRPSLLVPRYSCGPEWTRTTDLSLIRGVL